MRETKLLGFVVTYYFQLLVFVFGYKSQKLNEASWRTSLQL